MSTSAKIIEMIKGETLDMDALEAALTQASHGERMDVLGALTPKLQARLFEGAQGRLVTLEQIVPSSTAPLTEVIHEGQNTLPAFRHFQKRFCRPPAELATGLEREVVWGYNHQGMSGFTGPGYFVGYDHAESGEVWIDYRELPAQKPEQWPEIMSNKAKLGFLVYANMVDRLRRLSPEVTIGRAYKKKPMSAWFTLVRAPS